MQPRRPATSAGFRSSKNSSVSICLLYTSRNFTDRIEELVGMSAKVDEDFLEELEMILLSGDVGVKTTEKLIDAVRQAAKKKEIEGTEQVLSLIHISKLR